MDPVADVPIRRLVRMRVRRGGEREQRQPSCGRIPGDWLLPFLHQRYDDTSGEGIDV